MAESTARIGIYADDKASATVKSVQGHLQGLMAEAKKSILTGVGLAGGVAAFNLLGNAVRGTFGFMGDAVKAASNLAESQGKVNVVFGLSSKEITAWAATASRAFGMSKQQALEAAGTYGNLFQAFGIGQEKATSMSKTLVELAADLASFNNTSVDDALVALRSGLSGETEPLKRYGIAISDARMRTELMAQGVTNLGATLTPLQKTQAAYALILKDSTLAQGDFKRTADGLANTQRTLDAEMADLSAEIGQKLLPILLELAKFARDILIPVLRDTFKAFGDLGRGMSDIGQAWATVGMDFGAMSDTIHDVADAVGSDFQTIKDKVKRYMLEMGMSFDDAVANVGADMGQMTTVTEEGFRETHRQAETMMDDIHATIAENKLAGAVQLGIIDPIWYGAQEAKVKAQAEAAKIPKAMGDAILGAEKDLTDSVKTLTRFLEEALTPAQERAAAIAFLTSKAYADALASNKPAAIAKAQELANAANAVLYGAIADGTAAGTGLGAAWVAALNAALARGTTSTATWIYKYDRMLSMAGSPKYTHAIEAGLGVAKGWLSGINKGLGGGSLNLPTLPGAGGGMAFAGAGGGPVTIQVQVDGRTLAEIVDRQLYYMKPVQGALGRG